MHTIEKPKVDNREKVRILDAKDLDVSYFCGSGAGGQARNKVHSGCQIVHRETGSIGRASDSRSLADNKASAFKRLLETPKMKWWLAKKVAEVRCGETLETVIAKETTDTNMKYEVKDASGRWEEVPATYFSTPSAQEQP